MAGPREHDDRKAVDSVHSVRAAVISEQFDLRMG
jgi:hypothetical protein